MRFIKLLINIYISKSLMAYHQLLFAPIPFHSPSGEGEEKEKEKSIPKGCLVLPQRHAVDVYLLVGLRWRGLLHNPNSPIFKADYSPRQRYCFFSELQREKEKKAVR